ncbi:hypothetical protein W97_08135 [Coniosporium apollinis CBS 100218]|uniref:LsmAD domain-containing protein n=1 Tax=Coniosporium apollinis (strain CBS 100218) TaxID=1168221 RepID=R7Z3X9_CONA1|nr:uncharacterized protein W97_08135 [Coniosporium apollinis CBS 100218]EON68877.1 hypothetical protein W97_08135 [Coniosporium apollinis CBS 100218]
MASASKESNTPEKHANDRLMFLFANFTGLASTVTTRNGEQFSGIFSGVTTEASESRYKLKMVKRLQPPNDQQPNGASESYDEYVGTGADNEMAFEIQDVVDLAVSNVMTDKAHAKPQNGASSGFKIDTDISGNVAFRERDLQRWEPAPDSSAVGLSLDESGNAGWDQFETNKRLFAVESSYDENLYTTTIDRSNPLYKQRAAHAERIAREIEGSSATNIHVAEERGNSLVDDSGANEEEKYSGVRRDFPPLPSGQFNKYTPPARRAPTGQPTVPGAPVDPAIISSQIARPAPMSSAAAQGSQAAPAAINVVAATPEMPSSAEVQMSPPAAPAAESNQKPASSSKTVSASLAPTAAVQKPNIPQNPPTTVEKQVLNAYKEFAANEKLKAASARQQSARQDKNAKINDLKKFSLTFKLNTPVPQDLVPILAKDKTKQEEIMERSVRQMQELKSTPVKSPAAVVEQKTPRPVAAKHENGQSAQVPQTERQNVQRTRPSPGAFPPQRGERPPQAPNSMHSTPNNRNVPLGHRLAATHDAHKRGQMAQNIPPPIPIQDVRMPSGGPSAPSSGLQTPTSNVSSRFNVRAMEFRPNPAANTFMPNVNQSSGSSPRTEIAARPQPRKATQPFFDGSKPKPVIGAERPSIEDAFNPITRMMREAEKDGKTKDYAHNGGIPPAYRTPPVWEVTGPNKDKTYNELFEKAAAPVQPVSVPHAVVGNAPMPHVHQLPPHLQGPQMMSQHQTPHQTPRHMHAEPHHVPAGPHHFDGGQRMQFSSSQSSVHPSPRVMQPFMAYSGQGPQPMQVFQQPMQGYAVSPHMHHPGVRQAGPPQFAGPQGPVTGGPVLVANPAGGHFMNVQMQQPPQMYSPNPAPAYLHHGGQMQGPPMVNGYPSPRPPGAHMMSPQGSQQGHQPQQIFYVQQGQPQGMPMHYPGGPMTPQRMPYAQPHQQHYGTSPHIPHHFPHQPHRGTPSATYSQPMMPSYSMQSLPPQGLPPTGPAMPSTNGADEAK